MVFLCTAIYDMAEPFIKKLNLKKDLKFNKFQVFKNIDTYVLITGYGKISAAIAVTYLLSQLDINEADFLVDIGTCISMNIEMPASRIFFANKIVEYETEKCFYPDMLYKHPLSENSIQTVQYPINSYDQIKLKKPKVQLLDTEASGIYEAASVFLKPNQISFIKIVSNYNNDKDSNKEALNVLIQDKIEIINDWVNEVRYINDDINLETKIITDEEKEIVDKMAHNLKLSCSMQNSLCELLTYYKLKNKSIALVLNEYADVMCKSKTEGKEYFAELRTKLS